MIKNAELHNKIYCKLITLQTIIQKFPELYDGIDTFKDRIKSCLNDYTLNILPCYITGEYNLNIAFDYLFEIDNFINQLIEFFKNYEYTNSKEKRELDSNIQLLQSVNGKLEIDNKIVSTCNSDICEFCGGPMYLLPDSAEINCTTCGILKSAQVSIKCTAEPISETKSLTNTHEPMKHYKMWINKIHGFEKQEIPSTVIEKIKYCIKRDRLVKRDITIKILRKYLKDLSLTDYNSDIVLLSIQVGGPQPPKLSFEDNETHSKYFQHIMIILDKLESHDSNRPYYPSFIYKIYEFMFKADPVKREILNFIHIQSKHTTIKFNKLFEKICKYGDGELGITL